MPTAAPTTTDAARDAAENADARAGIWHKESSPERAARANRARRASGRRRHIDPTTTERDYSPAELEFMRAIQDYKLATGRLFPSYVEALDVLRGLGYRKPGDAGLAS